MKRILLLLTAGCTMILHTVSAQTKVVTTGNNLVNPADPYSADIVIGSDQAGGIRHDASMMWWSSGSASRISNTGDVFYLSRWSTTTPNIGLSAAVGGSSYFMGNVGIGTRTPATPLHLVVPSVALTDIPMQKWDPSVSGYNLVLSNYNSVHGLDYRFTQLHAGAPYPVLTFQAGNVGIGTVNPDTKLAVKGTIHASEIKVDLNVPGPDYVFEPDYQLITLSKLKAYLDKNHHLPEMPSADQMAKVGLNLGEMNTKLLKKVEELTLYLIEQKAESGKRAQWQEVRIRKLEQRLNRLTGSKTKR
jgi:hypothetical protein